MPPDPNHAPWWRDPLQPEPSAYEVFELSRTATLAEVNAAASAKLGKVPQRTWKAARTALIQPVDRAVADLFLYNSAQFASSAISPERDHGCLGSAARGASQRQWLLELRERHPAPPLCHGLAIFWYWWAVHADASARDRVNAGGLPYANDAERNANLREAHRILWRRAIGAWNGLVEEDEAIRSALADAPSPIRMQALAGARERVVRTLVDSAGAWREIGTGRAGALVAMYEDLAGEASSDAHSAKEVHAAGVKFRGRRLVGGRILLAELGLTTAARDALGARAASAISPYQRLAALINAGEPAAAIAAIMELPDEERERDEVRRVAADAHHALALTAASLNDYPTALHEWDLGLAEADGGQGVLIMESLASTCRDRASQLSRRRSWDELIDLLDGALSLVPGDESLTPLLVDALTSRGVQRVVQQQQRKERQEGARDEWLALSALGVRDVERAAHLGGRRAIDELSVIRGWMTHLEDLGLPGAEMLAAALSAANRDDWDTAIDTLQRAVDQFGTRMAPATRHRALSNLSIALGNRALERLSEVDKSGLWEGNREPLLAASQDAQRAAAADPTNTTARELVKTLRAATYRLVPGGPGSSPFPLAPTSSGATSRPTSSGGAGAFVLLAMIGTAVVCCGLSSLSDGGGRSAAVPGNVPAASIPASTPPAPEVAAPTVVAPTVPISVPVKARPTSKGTAGARSAPVRTNPTTSVASGSGEVVYYDGNDAVAVALVGALGRLEAALQQRESELKSEQAAMERESAKLDALQTKYDRDGATDEQASAFTRRARAYNASVTAYNAELATQQADQVAYDKKWDELRSRSRR